MAHPTSKIDDYLKHRKAGSEPVLAARLAGYSQTNIQATASRLESREDVKSALRKSKRESKVQGKSFTGIVMDEYESKGRRKPTAADSEDSWKLKDKYESPLAMYLDIMNNPKAPASLRIQSAKEALPYCNARKESSKKQERDDAGKKAATKSRFATPAMPTQLRRAA